MLSLASGTSAAFAEEKVTVSFNNTDIKDVIRWAADLTDKNILVNKAVAGKVTVIAGEPMSKAEAYQVFLSILQVNDIAVVETPTSLKIFPEQAAKTNSIPLIEGVNEVGDEDLVVRIIKIKNVAATQIIPLLKPLTPASAHFQAYPETNILIIADRASNIKQIAEIVERIDQAGTIDIEIIQLQYASAKDIVNVVSSLVPKTAPAAKGTPESNSLNYAADERSNSILMTGDPVTRMQLR
ncbi:MAG: hypothetical protein KDI30_00840, partial [Pseudomonadales bacterium]|nr:hypothetical protein [Pseudomonadales bacterium]